MTTFISSIAWQYTAVSLILLGCMAWMALTLRKRMKNKKRGKNSYCNGCALTDACSKKALFANKGNLQNTQRSCKEERR